MPATREPMPVYLTDSCMERKSKPKSHSVLRSLPVRDGWKWKRIYPKWARPERKTWQGTKWKGKLIYQYKGGPPRSGRKLWAREWTAVEPATVYKDVSPTFERLYGDAVPNGFALAALHDWRDRLHQTGVYERRSVDTLTSRKRKAFIRRHRVRLDATVTYRLPLDKLEPAGIRPYK